MVRKMIPMIKQYNITINNNENTYDMDKLLPFLHKKDPSLKRKVQANLVKIIEGGNSVIFLY